MATNPPVITLKELCSRARVDEDTPVVYKSLQVRSIPGLYSVISSEKVRAALKRIGLYALKPVHMKPSTNYKTLDDALSVTSDDGDSLAFSEIYQRIKTSLDSEDSFPLVFMFEDGLQEPTDDFVKTLCQDIHILGVTMESKTSASPPSSSTNRETYICEVLSTIILGLLGPNSFVFRECELGSPQLPHGNVDIVAGVERNEECQIFVAACVDGNTVELGDPLAVSAKRNTKLPKKAINPQFVVESCAFSEAVSSHADKPTVLLAANLETCRPFIRVVKDDLLLTTSSHVDWNLNEELCYEGVVFLLLMLMSPIRPQYPKLSFERIHSVMEVMEKDNKGKCMSGWDKFYSNCGKKYEGIVPQLESQTTQPRKTTASHPQLLDHDKVAAIDAAIKALGHKKRRTD